MAVIVICSMVNVAADNNFEIWKLLDLFWWIHFCGPLTFSDSTFSDSQYKKIYWECR